uniref:BTB domain-containing protein n=1 Tax=Panagrolaimus davidi TaxID=227884 RepID=A0A914R2H2_9BILA
MENIFEQECNFEMKWIIPRSKFESIKDLDYCKSDIFKAAIPGVTFALKLYPNGEETVNDKTYVYLSLYKGMMESVDYNLIVELEGTMKGRGLKIEKKKHIPLIKALADRCDMDVTLHTEDQEIKVHKYVLINRSPVFAKMLKDNQEMFIELPEFSTSVIEAVIDFCYGKDIKSLINLQNGIEFLRFSDKFKMEDLKNTIEEYLIQQISDKNVCQFSSKSVEFNAKQLRECCICFLLLKKPEEISNVWNWEILDKEICQEIVQRALAFVSKNCF